MSETLERDDIQGLVARGYGNLSAASFLLLEILDPAPARAWLGRLAERITPGSARPDDRAVNVAFSATGLGKLGLAPTTLALFSQEFAGGMTTAHRRRVLGDVDASDPDRWSWGGPRTQTTELLLLLYARDEATLAGLEDELVAGLASGGLALVERLGTAPLDDREHFGFRDGISQPTLEGMPRPDLPTNIIKTGEFVLGYQNEYGLYTDRPLLDASADPGNLLPPVPGNSSERDLGRNGSYLVFRQLSQDARGFWRFLDEATRTANGTSDPLASARLAAKMVGRWPNGAPLTISPDRDDPRFANANDFGYGQADPAGLNCPIGAHVRRAHPRDSLDPDPGTDRSYELDKRHRLLRRGRKYGPPVHPDEQPADGAAANEARGLHFICLCANLARQFDFVQHTWINNQKFDGLYDEVDPLIGRRDSGGASFSVPRRPFRQRITGLPSFVTVRGGAYFFLPGLRAIRYLASLSG